MTTSEPQTAAGRFHRIVSFFMVTMIQSLQSVLCFTDSLPRRTALNDRRLPFNLSDVIFVTDGVLLNIAGLLLVGLVLHFNITHICRLWSNFGPSPTSNLPDPVDATRAPLAADPQSAESSQAPPSSQSLALLLDSNSAFHDSPAALELATARQTEQSPAKQQAEIPALLQYIATILLERYLKECRTVDLAVCIDVLELAKELWPPHHPYRPNTFNTLAIAMFFQYRRSPKASDLSNAIALHRETLDLQRPAEAAHTSSLKVLGDAALVWCRQHHGYLHLLGGINVCRNALDIRLPGHLHQYRKEYSRRNISSPSNSRPQPAPQDVSSMHDTAVHLFECYQREGGPAVLTKSIELFQKALSLLLPGDLMLTTLLNDLAVAIMARYERYGGERDVADAINLYREALSVEPLDHPDRSISPSNLAHAIMARYQRDGGERDLSDGINLHRKALSLRPPGHPDRSSSLNNFANAIMNRYERDGGERDLSDAIDLHREALSLRPPGSPDRWYSLNNLANAIMNRYQRDGGERDLSDAIGLYREALSLQPLGHPNHPKSLNNLANAIMTRYGLDGGERDLSDGINLHREALSLRPPGHPDRSSSLNNFANAIMTRYERDGGERDLSDAINLYREALSLRPLGYPNRSNYLSHLASTILTRYQRDGGERDLSDAIDLHREALSLQPLGHPNRSSSLNNFANAIMNRYERDGGERDLSDAIDLHREALSLQPLGHPNRSSSLNSLADAILKRYQRDGGEHDLLDGIDLHREALSLQPLGHPNHSSSLNSLANAILKRYQRDGGEHDLSDGIDLHREALSLQPPGHLGRPSSLNRLAYSIMTRYERDGGEHDLADAINLHREALSLRPLGHPDRSDALNGLADAIIMRYRWDGDERDLSNGIELHREALSLRPLGHPNRSKSLERLAEAISMRVNHSKYPARSTFGRSERDGGSLIQKIIQLLREAATARTSPIPHRLDAALRWHNIASGFDHSSTLESYRSAFTLLGSALALGRSMQDRHTNLLSRDTSPLPTKSLALDAALWALSGPFIDPKLAVELLDQGRNVLLASVGQFRADLSDVRRNNPALADEFSRTSRLLESAILTGKDISERKSPHEDPTNRYKRISTDWEAVVAKIRLLPGCEFFLLPAPYVKLQEAAAEGPVIVIFVGKERSTAIIVMSKGEPHAVDLPDASEDALESLHKEWEDALTRLPDEIRVTRKLPGVLSKLWSMLVQPIIHELKDRLAIPLHSRIWWYPTSWASFLPLHAAGSYKKNGINVPDLYISSYTPTLQALSRARRDRPGLDLDTHLGLLMVSQPKTEGQDEIVGVNTEVDVVQRLVPNVTLLSGDKGTKGNVLQEMRHKSWIHLACHGVPDPQDPFQSHFALHDGPLSLQDIITNELPSAEFAYLSACHSAAQDRKLPDEGLTLAGGMQFAGLKSVVGTLWKMADEDAPTLAKVFYKSVAKRSGDEKAFDCTKTAEALHDAVKELRRKKVPLFRWVNLVHYGI